MIPNLSIDTFLSDPLLMVGALLVIIFPIVFLIALYNFIRAAHAEQFAVPEHYDEPETPAHEEPAPVEDHEPEPRHQIQSPFRTTEPSPEPEEVAPKPAPVEIPKQRVATPGADQTIVMPPGMAELQAQFEIAITQIKNLNRKVHDMEGVIERLKNQGESKLEPNELKEPPMNAAEFNQKLLKVVEHVIVLEREVAKLKGQPGSSAAGQSQGKPPVMPL